MYKSISEIRIFFVFIVLNLDGLEYRHRYHCPVHRLIFDEVHAVHIRYYINQCTKRTIITQFLYLKKREKLLFFSTVRCKMEGNRIINFAMRQSFEICRWNKTEVVQQNIFCFVQKKSFSIQFVHISVPSSTTNRLDSPPGHST